jgi:excisionase family DNA binding protein
MNNQLLLTSITFDELKTVISESISTELQKFRPSTELDKSDQELIKIDDVAKMLNVSKVTIFNWKKSGKIPFYRIASQIFFKKSEVLDSLKKIEKRRF